MVKCATLDGKSKLIFESCFYQIKISKKDYLENHWVGVLKKLQTNFVRKNNTQIMNIKNVICSHEMQVYFWPKMILCDTFRFAASTLLWKLWLQNTNFCYKSSLLFIYRNCVQNTNCRRNRRRIYEALSISYGKKIIDHFEYMK